MPVAQSACMHRQRICLGLILTAFSTAAIADERGAKPAGEKPAAKGRVAMQQMEVNEDPGEGRVAPYLGVAVAPIDERLRAQLVLPEETGLVVEEVDQGSPAQKGGIRRLDILMKLNDQILCTPDQLAALVKVSGKGKRVRLTVLRGGREKDVMVTLGAQEVRQEAVANNPAGPFAGMPQLPPQFQDLMARGGLLNQPGMNAANNQSMSTIADQRGSIEVRGMNGKRSVVIKDRSGKVVYEGPLNSEADLKKVPEAFRDLVARAMG